MRACHGADQKPHGRPRGDDIAKKKIPKTAPTADLTGWQVAPFTGEEITHDCYQKGDGPGVILVPEIPGITPEVLGLGEHLVGAGFTVVIPSLFGTPGQAVSGGYTLKTLGKLCVAKEFRAFATNAHRPVADFLRFLARDLNGRTPGPGVGIIGMCFTGGFALAAAVDDAVLAPVLSQPSVPFPLSKGRMKDPGVSEGELAQVAGRTKDGLCLIGLRFSADKAAPVERFITLRERLGDAFEVITLDSSASNPDGNRAGAHSVLTADLRPIEGHPTMKARDRVVEFLHERLTPQPT